MQGLINDNHVENYLKEILAIECYGLIVNNRPSPSKKKNNNFGSNFGLTTAMAQMCTLYTELLLQ